MKDLFSQQSSLYAKFRPVYPQALFDFVLSLVPGRALAWDCGTGNGQTAAVLAKHFHAVIATDISWQQLEQAVKLPNIEYRLEPAEHTNILDRSVDLITVSQALHWFHFDEFYAKVNRVAKPGAVFAAWTYRLLSISPEIDQVVRHYHDEVLSDYWSPERHYVENGYADLPFPYHEIQSPHFAIEVNWSLEQLAGYLNTWSAAQKFIAKNGCNIVDTLMADIRKIWGAGPTRLMAFPITLKATKINQGSSRV